MLYALQRQLIYFPDATKVPSAADVIAGSRDVTLHTKDGHDLGAWFVPAKAARTPGWLCCSHPATVATGRAGRCSRRH